MKYEVRENNLVYIDPNNWRQIYELLNEFSLVPEDICSILKCDRKYVQRITNQIPHLFLNSKIRQILLQNVKTSPFQPNIMFEQNYIFLRNFYFFSKTAFLKWLENKATLSCESLFVDLTWFLKESINDKIVNAFDYIRYYQKFAPHGLSAEERLKWYNIQTEKIAISKEILESSLNEAGQKIFHLFLTKKLKKDEMNLENKVLEPQIGKKIDLKLNINNLMNKNMSWYTVEELADGKSRQMGYINAYQAGAIKMKLGDQNSKVLFGIINTFDKLKMPVLCSCYELKNIFDESKFVEFVNKQLDQ